ncbi:hypothetical protein ACFP1I_05280 [Dyadobacter subterraneus]|uniref:AraC family transcriptional regulator n=1 Tax=Dyadobacter subterraneus TaxID=2773304 RepID=A0ABR9WG27_9BACT|nr:hypothetical protein [Dyadobacter subterraneus]MBE9464457.1 hypothetical protein [Dyadobacter subterraneus]
MPAIKFNAHKKFHLLQSKTRIWESCNEQLEHYRIIFILSGQGKFILDGEICCYFQKGIIFLRPGQQPIFQEDKETEIFVIAFDTYLAEDFQKKKLFSPDFADTYKQAENLCNNFVLIQGRPIPNEREGKTITYMIVQILFELGQQPASHLKMIKGCIEMIVTVLARNNYRSQPAENQHKESELTESIIEYIKGELLQKKTIRIPNLLLMFNISEEVLNLYIMNRTGMSLRNFIFKFKADLFKAQMLKVDIGELVGYL